MTLYDKVMIAGVLVLSILLAGFLSYNMVEPSGGDIKATIWVEGEEVATIPLGDGNEVIRVPFSRGVAEIGIYGGKVRMLEMPDRICPKKICSKTGFIGMPGQMIVCLPNKVIVSIVADYQNQIDMVSF